MSLIMYYWFIFQIITVQYVWGSEGWGVEGRGWAGLDSSIKNKYILFLICRLPRFGRLQTIIRHSAMNVTEVCLLDLSFCVLSIVLLYSAMPVGVFKLQDYQVVPSYIHPHDEVQHS